MVITWFYAKKNQEVLGFLVIYLPVLSSVELIIIWRLSTHLLLGLLGIMYGS